MSIGDRQAFQADRCLGDAQAKRKQGIQVCLIRWNLRLGSASAEFNGFHRCKQKFLKGLILAQNERWRRGLGMQVERIPLV